MVGIYKYRRVFEYDGYNLWIKQKYIINITQQSLWEDIVMSPIVIR